MSSGTSGTTWRYEVVGDVLTATNKTMTYTIRLGVPYQPMPQARARATGPIGPRSVTQFLDGGARLYTFGVDRETNRNAKTVALVSSFVGTYQVPRVRLSPEPARHDVRDDDRLARLEQSVGEAVALLRSIADGLGVK